MCNQLYCIWIFSRTKKVIDNEEKLIEKCNQLQEPYNFICEKKS